MKEKKKIMNFDNSKDILPYVKNASGGRWYPNQGINRTVCGSPADSSLQKEGKGIDVPAPARSAPFCKLEELV